MVVRSVAVQSILIRGVVVQSVIPERPVVIRLVAEAVDVASLALMEPLWMAWF